MISLVCQTSITELQPVSALVETRSRRPRAISVSLQYDAAWRSFLWKMVKPIGLFDEGHIRAVTCLWDSLQKRVAVQLPLPLTQPTTTGNIQLAWDAGRFYLEIDVRADGKLEWFFRDRDTNTLDGTEDEPESTVSPALLERLGIVVSA